MRDPYRVFGLEPDATEAEIRARYRRLAYVWHPDRHHDPVWRDRAQEEMKDINAAFATLSQADRRAEYDRNQRESAGERAPHAQATGAPPRPARPPARADWPDTDRRPAVVWPLWALAALLGLLVVALVTHALQPRQNGSDRESVAVSTIAVESTPARAALTPGYDIEQVQTSRTGVEVDLYAPAEFPMDDQRFFVRAPAQDQAGNWRLAPFSDSDVDSVIGSLALAPTGTGHMDLTSGTFLLLQAADHARVAGFWGNLTLRGSRPPLHGLLFTVREGWTTKIILRISRLSVAVTQAGGQKAARMAWVGLSCEGRDVTGQPLGGDDCPSASAYTNAAGLVNFYVGPGVYHVQSEGNAVTRIEVAAGEEARALIALP